MKKLVLLIGLVASCFAVSAQSLERFVIASSGGFDHVGSITISYTIGELAAVESFVNNPIMHLTQGFQQPENWFTGIKTNPVQNASFSVFPNPATEFVTVRFEGLTDGPLEVSLYDVIGQRVKTAQFSREIGQTDYQLNLSDIAQGLYIIRLTGKQQGMEFERHDRLNVIY